METKEKFIYVNEDECKMGEINCVQIGYRIASFSLLFSIFVGVPPMHPNSTTTITFVRFCFTIFIVGLSFSQNVVSGFFILFLYSSFSFAYSHFHFIVSNEVIISFELMNFLIFLFLRHSVPLKWTFWCRFLLRSDKFKICVFGTVEAFVLVVADEGQLRGPS